MQYTYVGYLYFNRKFENKKNNLFSYEHFEETVLKGFVLTYIDYGKQTGLVMSGNSFALVLIAIPRQCYKAETPRLRQEQD